MSFTLLVDLDDTLLDNPMGKFLPAYLGILGKQLSQFAPSKDIPAAVLAGTEMMIKNEDPASTLEDRFDSYFYPHIGISKDKLIPEIDFFYENVFPGLQLLTKPIPEAINAMKNISQNGISFVLATNPLFPKSAIFHRLDWAKLNMSVKDFKDVTTFEQYHFAKPNPAYYAEILSKLGWPEGPVAMVGNDWEMDIKPAEYLGIPSFLLGQEPEQSDITRNKLSSSGSWKEFQIWIKQFEKNDVNFELLDSYLAYRSTMLATAAAIDSYSRQYPDLRIWKIKPDLAEWSLLEIISHISDVDEEVNLPRMTSIQNDPDPFFSAAFTDEWAKTRNYQSYDPKTQIERFITNRRKLIKQIDSFSKTDWDKPVTHVIFGPTTVLELIKFIAQHDRIHINQIYSTIITLNRNNLPEYETNGKFDY